MIPDNEFSNDLEYMKSMDEAYHNVQKLEQSEKALRFQTRLDQSNAMKASYTEEINFGNNDIDKATMEWKKEIENWNKVILKNERNNGRDDVYEVMRTFATGRIYFDSIEDMIQQCKINLKGK